MIKFTQGAGKVCRGITYTCLAKIHAGSDVYLETRKERIGINEVKKSETSIPSSGTSKHKFLFQEDFL